MPEGQAEGKGFARKNGTALEQSCLTASLAPHKYLLAAGLGPKVRGAERQVMPGIDAGEHIPAPVLRLTSLAVGCVYVLAAHRCQYCRTLTSSCLRSWYRYDTKAERIHLLLPTQRLQSFVVIVEGVRVGGFAWVFALNCKCPDDCVSQNCCEICCCLQATLLQNPRGSIWQTPAREAVAKSWCTFSFEVPIASVVGVDYTNPLCQEGRLVLEAVSATRRQFKSVSSRALPAPLAHVFQC